MDEIKEHRSTTNDDFNALRVGMTNQSPASAKRLYYSPKSAPNSSSAIRRTHVFNTPSPLLKHYQKIKNILNTATIKPVLSVPAEHIREKGLSRI